MKDKKDKHKHHESTIGKIIYGFLLFAPLLAIAVTCITCFWNKEIITDAETAEINYKYESNEVTSLSSLLNGNIYSLTINEAPTNSYLIVKTDAFYNFPRGSRGEYIGYETSNTVSYIDIRSQLGTNNYINIQDQNGTTIFSQNFTNLSFPLTFEFIYIGNAYGLDNNNLTITQTPTEKIPILDVEITTNPSEFDTKNIFYYSINQVENNNLFNWSKNTTIYTVLNNTSNTLGITNTFWPMLMTYWLIISVIYILYDIILMMLVIFHRKVHCLQDSI